MTNQIDKTLINTISRLADKEKKIKEFKSRIRIKGKVIKKGKTKNGSIRLTIQKEDDIYNFIIVKTHKEKYELAEKLTIGSFVSAVGINKFRVVICTQLKELPKRDGSKQTVLVNS